MRLKLLPLFSLSLLLATPALAAPLTYEFSGFAPTNSFPWAGNYYVDMGIPNSTPFSGQFVLESDIQPYYSDDMQRSYFDQLTSFTVDFGTAGEYGTFTGPEGLQEPPPWGWNSSTFGLGNGVPGGPGAFHDQWGLYGSLAEPAGTPANVYYRFVLWGTSTDPLWETLPTLDALPGTDVFGTMGLMILATLYDDAGGWLGETRLNGSVTDLHRVHAQVPEPGTLALMIAALGGLALVGRRAARA